MKKIILLVMASFNFIGCQKLMPQLWSNQVHEAPHGNKAIFLLMGQSNMTGNGNLYPDPPSPTDPRLTMYKNGSWIPAQNPVSQRAYGGYSPSMAFGLEMVKLNPSTPIGLINCAQGGTLMFEWIPSEALYKNCLAQIRATEKDGYFAGVMFAQGEADAAYQGRDWPIRFMDMANDIHKNYPGVVIIYAQLGMIFGGDPQYESFRDLQATVNNGTWIRMISTRDLSLVDTLHFTQDSYDVLGKRFADAFYYHD